MEILSLDHDMAPSPVSSRLTLQASVDGEMSTNSESSVSGEIILSLPYFHNCIFLLLYIIVIIKIWQADFS